MTTTAHTTHVPSGIPRRRREAARAHTTRKTRFLLLAGMAATLAPAFLTTQPAEAQRGGPGAGMGAFRSEGQRLWALLDQRFDGLADSLSLTEAQAGLLEIVVADFRQTNEDALTRLAAMATEMRGLMTGGRPDRATIAGIVEKHGSPVRELAPALEALRTDIADLLEAEQLEKMRRLLAQRPRRPPPGTRP